MLSAVKQSGDFCMNAKRLLCLAGTTLAFTCLSSVAMAQTDLPESVRVPAGNKVGMTTTGVGEITYECRAKANMPNEMEWAFVGPKAVLNDKSGKQVGTYYGPPATWEAKDGSKLTGTQVAVAPSSAGNLPYQLVKANPAEGKGAMTGVTYIQRVALKGGVAPAKPCAESNKGAKEVVKYQADYLFWTAS
ncbi:hypothetical protein ALQ33_03238 [Pseudomonas syringae pv. philadelphi]|uniref:DUF3455 domain-containing protein n=2 Tax=Pseudomonas syringae group genomosp. 3 TaxID=251701 RepID=A0A3M3YE52_9PSED|nr:hypothetical protein ALQ33_03238 [Pseudomonas syringae pv. philadelphi]